MGKFKIGDEVQPLAGGWITYRGAEVIAAEPDDHGLIVVKLTFLGNDKKEYALYQEDSLELTPPTLESLVMDWTRSFDDFESDSFDPGVYMNARRNLLERGRSLLTNG